MEVTEAKLGFDDDFVCMDATTVVHKFDQKEKVIDGHGENIPRIIPAPIDPLRSLISSDSYINSLGKSQMRYRSPLSDNLLPRQQVIRKRATISHLEKKLKKIQGKQTDNIKGKDMITSLKTAKQEHLIRVIDGDKQEAFQEGDYFNNNSLSFSLQRKVNPEKQALNPQELFPLINDDVLAKHTEENNEKNADSELKDVT